MVRALCTQGPLQFLECQVRFLVPLYLPTAQFMAFGLLGSTIPMAYHPVGSIYPPASTVLVKKAMMQVLELELGLLLPTVL